MYWINASSAINENHSTGAHLLLHLFACIARTMKFMMKSSVTNHDEYGRY